MHYKNLLLLTFFLIFFCKNPKQVNTKNRVLQKDAKVDSKQSDCDLYWEKSFPSDNQKIKYINTIISREKLTKNNLDFLNALKPKKQTDLVFKNAISPIFRLSNSEIGIFSFPEYSFIDNKLISTSKEMDLIKKVDTFAKNPTESFTKIKFYPTLLNTVFKKKKRPPTYYYTTNKIDTTKIKELGVYIGECLEYYEYSIDTTNISLRDKVLFSSPFKIDLVFENFPNIDMFIQKSYKPKCYDCQNSMKFQKTFAKIKGTNNLYFVYADTFPINNKLDTPSRALVLVTKKNEIVYLWYDEIDLYGCSCL